jgi:hypothetical protein
MEEYKPKRKYKLDVPEDFPKLSKQISNLDDFISRLPYAKNLGTQATVLNNLKKNSIYKNLLPDEKSKDFHHNLNSQELKDIRNSYFKKLVISNPFYFPKELGLDEYKKPNKKAEKLNKILQHFEEIAKKEKLSLDLNSRKNSSVNNLASRKESLLENKRNRYDSINEEQDKKKKKLKGKENVEEEYSIEENSIEGNYGEDDYNEVEDYGHPDDEDSQNYNYSEDGGNDDDY